MKLKRTAGAAIAIIALSSPAFAGTLMCNVVAGPGGQLATTQDGASATATSGGSTWGSHSTDGVGDAQISGASAGPIGFIAGATPSTVCPEGYTPVGYAPTAAEMSVAGGTGAAVVEPNPSTVLYNNGGTPTNPNTVTVASGVNGTDATNVTQLTQGMATTLNTANSFTNSQVSSGMASTLGSANAYTDGKVSGALVSAGSYTDNKTRYFQANSTGPAAVASGTDSVAIGPGSVVAGNGAIGGGLNATASGDGSVVFGAGATGSATGAVAVGAGSTASGINSVALGNGSKATGTQSISIGTGNVVSGSSSGAIGDPSNVSGNGSYAVGNNNTVPTDNSFVLGNNVTTTQSNSVVLGNGSADRAATAVTDATINGTKYSFAGTTSPTSGVISVGNVGSERQIQNVAAGQLSATSTDAVNGSQLNATNQAVNALGANVTDLGSTTAGILGGGSTYDPSTGKLSAPTYKLNNETYHSVGAALGAVGSAIAGNNAAGRPAPVATGASSVAIGAGSVADRPNTVSFGTPGAERQLTNIAPGTTATDAVSLGQAQGMVGNGLQQANTYTDQQIQALDVKAQKYAAGVGALAMAASALVPNARSEGNSSVSMAAGTYGGESAVAAGLNYYASNQILLNAKVGVSSGGPARVGFAVGATIGF